MSTIVIYEAIYANQQRTITTDMQEIILFVRDTRISANVSCWVNGNCVAGMLIESHEKKEK